MTVATIEDLARMKQEILGLSAPASIVGEVAQSTKFRRMLGSDMAIGRLLTGPQFIDSVAIDNGAVIASKLEAQLVLATAIIAGAVSPADRLEFDATGLRAYGTVSATPNTNTLNIQNDGDFTFGVSPNQIAFVASTGVLTVPAAVITSLTIAAVGSGIVGGNYDTASGNPKLRLSTSGIEMWNASSAKTVALNAADGTFVLSNDPSGANRISIADTGIELWKSSTRQFYLQAGGATNAITMLLTGPGASDYIGMNPTDGLWLGASTYAGAATKFRVSPTGALQATSATISGAITATSGELQSLSVTGALTMGSGGIVRSSGTTTRVEMDNTGLYGYNAGTARFQLLNNGSGWLGASTTLAWTNAGVLTLAGFTATSSLLSSGSGGSYVTMSSGATAFSAGGATPASAPFNVSSAGALKASSLVITGTATFSGGSLTLPNGGTISSSTVDVNSGTLDGLTIDGTLTMASGGKILLNSAGRIEDADGSYWNQDGITLFSPTSQGDSILWKYSGWGTSRPYSVISVLGSTTQATSFFESYYGNGTTPNTAGAYLSVHGEAGIGRAALIATGNSGVNGTVLTLHDEATAANSYMEFVVRGNEVGQFNYTNRTLSLNGYLHPGNGTNQQTATSIRSAGTHLDMHLSDTAGSSGFRVLDSGGTVVWLVNSDGQMSLPGSDLSAAGTYYGRVPVAFNGGTKYIHLFNA